MGNWTKRGPKFRCPRCNKKGIYYSRPTHFDPESFGWRCQYCQEFVPEAIQSIRWYKFLVALRDEGQCDITGSWVRGDQRPDSDIDLVCPDEGIKKCIAIFDKFKVPWDSAIVGSITALWRETNWMERQVEVMEACWMTPEENAHRRRAIHIGDVRFAPFRRI